MARILPMCLKIKRAVSHLDYWRHENYFLHMGAIRTSIEQKLFNQQVTLSISRYHCWLARQLREHSRIERWCSRRLIEISAIIQSVEDEKASGRTGFDWRIAP